MTEQLYMLEIMIDKIGIFINEDDPDTDTDKGLIVRYRFGPSEEVIFRENQLAEVQHKETVVACNDQVFEKKWIRIIRVGKSYLFASYPDLLAITLSQCPIEFEMWTDGKERRELIGNGLMKWDSQFYAYLRNNDNPKRLHEPICIKHKIWMYADERPGRCGEMEIICRLSALGESIITEFQQIIGQEPFVFRSNKVPTMVLCERTEGSDINFCMVGNVYETITLEDPDVIDQMNEKIEICTEMDNCHQHGDDEDKPIIKPIEKIKMGDICGPCGNKNCLLAHKIKTYLRSLELYKKETKGKIFKDEKDSKNVCGTCGCKDDSWHRGTCPVNDSLPVCTGCGGVAKSGETCEDRIKLAHGKKEKKVDENKNKQINYLINITREPNHRDDNNDKPSLFGHNFIVNPCEITYPSPNLPPRKYCKCGPNADKVSTSCNTDREVSASSTKSMGNASSLVYNADVRADGKGSSSKFCTDIPDEKDKECKCNPKIPTPPCKTFDCECLTRAEEKETRKRHKTYCPAYKHKTTCPVTTMNDEDMDIFEEEEADSLPYGLPPVQLGPCPVIGRPCSVPDGYARMWKVGALENQELSWSDAGKVCCSKEFERIKKAIGIYMKAHEKEDDYRCLNRFYRDTDRRCCDREQRLLTLLGRSCCGSNKSKDQKDEK